MILYRLSKSFFTKEGTTKIVWTLQTAKRFINFIWHLRPTITLNQIVKYHPKFTIFLVVVQILRHDVSSWNTHFPDITPSSPQFANQTGSLESEHEYEYEHTCGKKWPEMVIKRSFMRDIHLETDFIVSLAAKFNLPIKGASVKYG